MIYGADFVAPYGHYYRNEMQDFGPWRIWGPKSVA